MRRRLTAAVLALSLVLLVPSHADAKPHKTIHVKGRITTVHADRGTLELEKKSGELVTLRITPATKYVEAKKPTTVTDLKRDARVSAHCLLENGKLTATKVVIRPAKR